MGVDRAGRELHREPAAIMPAIMLRQRTARPEYGIAAWGRANAQELDRNYTFATWGRYFRAFELRAHYRDRSHLVCERDPIARRHHVEPPMTIEI
jgi:hypothetical protein